MRGSPSYAPFEYLGPVYRDGCLAARDGPSVNGGLRVGKVRESTVQADF